MHLVQSREKRDAVFKKNVKSKIKETEPEKIALPVIVFPHSASMFKTMSFDKTGIYVVL